LIIRLLKFFLFLLLFFISYTLSAQVSRPFQFSFSANRDKAGAFLSIKVKIAENIRLFSIKKNAPDAVFISTVEFDSSASQYIKDSILEIGNLIKANNPTAIGSRVGYFLDSVEWKQRLNIMAKDSIIIKGKVSWLAGSGNKFPSGEEAFSVKLKAAANNSIVVPKKDNNSLRFVFLICLITGLISVLTPCVFPLIPITVSFFLNKGNSKAEGLRNATWYSLSIILIYTIPTLIITLIFGGNALYNISTNPVTNLSFFIIFILFAVSFFGAFEIGLPSSWANKAGSKADKGGLTGIFFMALTLVIVSFSCTGPVVGTLLGKTATQGLTIAPVIGMLGFGLGLSLPFSLFAYFPSMLKSLPKSGGWLNTVKVAFGFIELALAMKFLSNVDLIYHWRLLDRDIFLVIWIMIFVLLGVYLLGKLKFSHDSDLPYLTVPRLFFAMASLGFALYLLPGLWGAPLKGISGWLPHTDTQDFNLQEIKYQLDDLNTSTIMASSSTGIAPAAKKYIDKLHTPFNIPGYFDLSEGIAAAKILNKPIMLDFTGHSCANCRKMEAEVWSDPEVLRRIKQDFVLISLYVDESTALPENEQYTNKEGERIITLGDKNLDYEISKFGFNAQPLYMFLDVNGNPLSDIKYGYDSNVPKFINHLETVKKKFEEGL